MHTADADAAAQAASVARDSYGRLIAILSAPTRDIAAAEDALSDAFEEALTRWPVAGIPDNPVAWLLTVARNRQRDRWGSAAVRTSVALDDAVESESNIFGAPAEPVEPDELDQIPDKRLALLFVCAHPAIDPNIRAPLMLQTVLGFQADEIAVAFAMPTATMAQRLVRAKRRIRDTGIPFAVPSAAQLGPRLESVLEAIYGTYAIDWQGIAGASERDSLAGEALYLAELLATLARGEPEADGLAALLCLSMARLPGRLDAAGALVPLGRQDVSTWDAALIARGEAHLMRIRSFGENERAAQSGKAERHGPPSRPGRFQLEAAIQSVHCARRVSGVTEWPALLTLYEALIGLAPTLGALVSRAAVIGETDGAAAGLAALQAIDKPTMARFQPAWATRAHLLAGAGRTHDATSAFDKAISLTTDPITRTYLESRRDAVAAAKAGRGGADRS